VRRYALEYSRGKKLAEATVVAAFDAGKVTQHLTDVLWT